MPSTSRRSIPAAPPGRRLQRDVLQHRGFRPKRKATIPVDRKLFSRAEFWTRRESRVQRSPAHRKRPTWQHRLRAAGESGFIRTPVAKIRALRLVPQFRCLSAQQVCAVARTPPQSPLCKGGKMKKRRESILLPLRRGARGNRDRRGDSGEFRSGPAFGKRGDGIPRTATRRKSCHDSRLPQRCRNPVFTRLPARCHEAYVSLLLSAINR